MTFERDQAAVDNCQLFPADQFFSLRRCSVCNMRRSQSSIPQRKIPAISEGIVAIF
jgi:hypothetical protein